MTKQLNSSQTTAEAWEIGAALLNTQGGIVVLYKDENGIYNTVEATISSEILGGTLDAIVLTGEITPQPDPTADV